MKDIRLKDIIALLGGRTRIAVFAIEGLRSDYTKPVFRGCVDEDFRPKPQPTWTEDNKRIKKIREKYANYFVLDMNVWDNMNDQTLNIWVSEKQKK